MSYRKIYELELNDKVPDDFDVHHIDLNHKNNDIRNLIAIPKSLHQNFHKCINNIERERIKCDFEFEDLYKVGGNYSLEWCEIIQELGEYLLFANEIHRYIIEKELKLLSIK